MSIKNLATIDEEETKVIEEIWTSVVVDGKKSDKLKKHADSQGKTGPKYRDPENLGRTGACAVHECVTLYRLAKYYRPRITLEVGTWFGTTAYTLAAVSGMVYTCDKNDLIIDPPENFNLKFYHGPSTKFWKKLGRSGVFADFVWADASLKVGDIERMLPLFKGPIRFAVHDYEEGEKGWRNMKHLGSVLGKQIVPEVEGIIAFYED